MSHRPQGLFAMRAVHRPHLFPPPLMKRLAELCDIDQAVTDGFRTDRAHRLLTETEGLITGRGCPTLDADVQLTSRDQMLSTCDVISLNAPPTADTYRMIDHGRLAVMRDGTTPADLDKVA